MRQALFACALMVVMAAASLRADATTYTGTWTVQSGHTSDRVQLELRYDTPSEQWEEGNDVAVTEFRGLSNTDVNALRGEQRFSIVRDAGTFQCVGTFDGGNGGGTWTFAPNAGLASALAGRGISAPNESQQFKLAMSDFHLSTLDALLSSGFQRPSIDDLVRMGEHGVNDAYIRGMKGIPLNPKTVDELIRMRDHGVDPGFAAAMLKVDPQLSGEDLVKMRDHGVTAGFVDSLQRLGYHPSAEDLVRLCDHGVTISYIQRLSQHGYTHLSISDLIRLRDSGF